MATVYMATDTRLTRTVAVKVMHLGLGDDAEFARKFIREARSAARLSHPYVVSVYDQGHDDGRPYIVMEYVEGRTLRDMLNHGRRCPRTGPWRSSSRCSAALAAAHEAGLVHRDVKPENVLISDRGQIKVVDFGLAKAISAQTSTATQGLLIGTVAYLPPELVLSGRADRAHRRLQRRRRAVRDADRPQAARRRHPDPGRVRPRPQRRATAVAVPHRGSHPAVPGCPGHRSHGSQSRRPPARRQGVPVPGPPGAGGAPRWSERRSRADPGPQRAAALRPVGRVAARRRPQLRDHPAGAAARRRAGRVRPGSSTSTASPRRHRPPSAMRHRPRFPPPPRAGRPTTRGRTSPGSGWHPDASARVRVAGAAG